MAQLLQALTHLGQIVLHQLLEQLAAIVQTLATAAVIK